MALGSGAAACAACSTKGSVLLPLAADAAGAAAGGALTGGGFAGLSIPSGRGCGDALYRMPDGALGSCLTSS